MERVLRRRERAESVGEHDRPARSKIRRSHRAVAHQQYQTNAGFGIADEPRRAFFPNLFCLGFVWLGVFVWGWFTG